MPAAPFCGRGKFQNNNIYTLVNTYNKIPLVPKLNPDLDSFVTEQGIKGLFTKVAQEEKAIRANPIKRTTGLHQKVFGYADSQK